MPWMPPMAQQRVVSQITVRHVAHRCASNAEQCAIRNTRLAPLSSHSPLPLSLYSPTTAGVARLSQSSSQFHYWKAIRVFLVRIYILSYPMDKTHVCSSPDSDRCDTPSYRDNHNLLFWRRRREEGRFSFFLIPCEARGGSCSGDSFRGGR